MSNSRNREIWALVALLAVSAVALYLVGVVPIPDRSHSHDLVWFAAISCGFMLAETSKIRLRLGSDAIGFSLMEFPLVIGLYFCDPRLLVIARVLGAVVAFSLQRSPVQKTAFNLALFTLETAGAVTIWHAVVGSAARGGPGDIGPQGWVATGLAVTFTGVVGALLVAVAINIASGERPPLRDCFSAHKIGELASASFALVAAYVISVDWRAVWMLIVVTGVLWLANRSFDRARRRAESLAQVNGFTDAVGREVELQAVVTQVLLGVRRAFNARGVELRLSARAAQVEDWVLTDDSPVQRPARLLERLANQLSEPALLGIRREGGTALKELGYHDGMFVPLRSEGRFVGSLVVADMMGDAAIFGMEDLGQLQALANHAAVAIDNALRADLILRQAEEREHAAMHDELTGLPNRQLFSGQVDRALERRRAAVLLVDLASFRAVNDTLGHQVGDRLLKMVAERIQAATPDDAHVARLGGDEFAVLLPGADDLAARSCASVVRAALTRSFDLDGLDVAVDASVGVVVAERGGEAGTVLRQADLALSSAQENRSGSVVFDPGMDRSDSSRLGLLADLRGAVEEQLLEVHYQPQIDLSTGEILGVEALARWWHPAHGAISPDEFIPLAEHSGLITPLTMLVLRKALQDTERFQTQPGDFGIAVNISPRSLLDRGFVDEVARELARVNVPASALTLEITETSLMTDPEEAVAALERLRAIGVRLSVDDLGTGYSSLAYLLRLPVDEVKVDRTFIATLPDPAAAKVVSAIVDLGHGLGRSVVAEGIEDGSAFDLLREMGCDSAQGFWMGRPMPVLQLSAYLVDHRGRRPVRLRRVR